MSGRVIVRVAVVLLAVCVGISIQGCRLTVASWGASAEPAVVRMADVEPGKDFENRHIQLEGFVPLFQHSYAKKGNAYCPLAPIPSTELSDDPLGGGSGRSARMIWALSASDRQPEMFGGRGLVMGTAESICSADARTSMKKRLGVDSVNDFYVIEFGREPSLFLGLTMLLGGMAAFLGVAFLAMKKAGV